MNLWLNSGTYREDIEVVLQSGYIPWEKMENKVILVTGGTGLIGSTLINVLLYAHKKQTVNLSVLALVRNIEKAKTMFAAQLDENLPLSFIEGTVESIPQISSNIDYIVHGANPTDSSYFIHHPVETIQTAIVGTKNLLDLAVDKQIKGFVFLSSMEVYGAPKNEIPLHEDSSSIIDTMSVRSSYPESKRMCETLCTAYGSEFNIPIYVVRLAQTFGPGVTLEDARAFAEFARCAVNGENIVLKTSGKSKRPYLYTFDAVAAIMTVLLRGETQNAYNVANPSTFCTIQEIAQVAADTLGNGKVKVVIKEEPNAAAKYMSQHYLNLAIDKISRLGWKPTKNLPEMYKRMIDVVE